MSEYENKTVVLESRDVNPFEDWSDWYGTEGEAVVTFQHIAHLLYEIWERQCVSIEAGERNIDQEKFDASEVEAPGIYRDETNYDDSDAVDESYTIIVPYDFMTPDMCRQWIQKLNEKFDRQFELSIDEEQEKMAEGEDNLQGKRLKTSEDSEGTPGEDEG